MISRYRAGPNLSEAVRVLRAITFASLAAGALAGCSIGVGGLSDDRVETTGSIRRADVSPLSPDLGQEDWRRAKAALAVALDPQGSGAAVKWDNPDTEASGTFTPVAQPYVKQDEICRAFLATIASASGRTSSLQGTACKLSAEEWQIRDVKTWRKPA